MQVSGVENSIAPVPSNDHKYSHSGVQGVSFANVMATHQSTSVAEDTDLNPSTAFAMDTNQGHQKVDLDDYLTPKQQSGLIDLKDIPLLLPTSHNIDALSKYSETKFKDLLQQYAIPSPPGSIAFDGEGKLVIPSDYPYSAELKRAFADKPGVENALRTTAALASHYSGIMEGAAFRDEMSTARNQADQDRIVQKYSYLFDDNRPASQIVLAFLEDGSMLVGEKSA
jgi:hypothetical protein